MNIATEIIVNYGIHYLANNALQLFNRTCVIFYNYASQQRATQSINSNTIEHNEEEKIISNYDITCDNIAFPLRNVRNNLKMPENLSHTLACCKKMLISSKTCQKKLSIMTALYCIYHYLKDFNSQIKCLHEMLKYSKEMLLVSKTSEEKISTLKGVCEIYNFLNDEDGQIEGNKQLLAVVEIAGDKYVILNKLAYLYKCKDNLNKAIECYKQNLEFAKTSIRKMLVLRLLMEAYNKQQDLFNCLFYYYELLKLNPYDDMLTRTTSIINNLGFNKLKFRMDEESGEY